MKKMKTMKKKKEKKYTVFMTAPLDFAITVAGTLYHKIILGEKHYFKVYLMFLYKSTVICCHCCLHDDVWATIRIKNKKTKKGLFHSFTHFFVQENNYTRFPIKYRIFFSRNFDSKNQSITKGPSALISLKKKIYMNHRNYCNYQRNEASNLHEDILKSNYLPKNHQQTEG